MILEAVAALDNAEAAQALIEAAAIGIAPHKLEAKAAPHLVRAEAQRWAGKLKSAAARVAVDACAAPSRAPTSCAATATCC